MRIRAPLTSDLLDLSHPWARPGASCGRKPLLLVGGDPLAGPLGDHRARLLRLPDDDHARHACGEALEAVVVAHAESGLHHPGTPAGTRPRALGQVVAEQRQGALVDLDDDAEVLR